MHQGTDAKSHLVRNGETQVASENGIIWRPEMGMRQDFTGNQWKEADIEEIGSSLSIVCQYSPYCVVTFCISGRLFKKLLEKPDNKEL